MSVGSDRSQRREVTTEEDTVGSVLLTLYCRDKGIDWRENLPRHLTVLGPQLGGFLSLLAGML